MTEGPLTPDEIAQVRDLLKYADQVEAEARYKAAVRLVFKTWRGTVVTIGGTIVAVLVLRDQIAAVWDWAVR